MTGQRRNGDRWKPSRAGIRNIWEYDEQVFSFADGRMILRGPNGSGKSNALALVFPFLFDGTMSAAAMDPFAGGRSMKSLLLGVLRDDSRSGFRHDQRLGYVWLEFARPGPDGEVHLTVGCGARARADTEARSWFFLTDRRVGIDLDLAPGGSPLTRGRLIEELGVDAVRDGAEEHRKAVARNLLGIESEQLGKLNGLIRALRRPQLAGKLNIDELSAVLSSGLPAVASETLDDIAASLDDLERVQHELTSVRDALATVDAFLPAYRSYLSGEARSRARAVVERDQQVTAERRGLERHEKRHRELMARDEALRRQRSGDESARAELTAERDALKDSERFRGAQELGREEAHAADLEATAAKAAQHHREAEQQAEELERRAGETEQVAQEAATKADRLLQDAMDHADRVRAVWSLDADAHHDPVELRSAVEVMVRERRGAVAAARKAIRGFEVAVEAHRAAEANRSEADEAVDDAAARVRSSTGERDLRRAELVGSVEAWLAAVPGAGSEVKAELVELVDLAAEGEPVRLGERYRLATESYRDRLRDGHGSAIRAIGEREAERDEVRRRRDAVAAEQDPGPVPPPWRTADRAGRTGAPLWACCDFGPDCELTPAERAGIEAALDAAGLLDAWLGPEGDVGDDIDVWLRTDAHGGGSSRDVATLASVLSAVVPDGSELSVALIDAVLGSIDLGSLGVAVGADGRFSLGPLAGRATRPVVEFIGATARAERRVRLLAELDEQLDGLAAVLEHLAAERDEAAAALSAWEAAADGAPDTRPLADAANRLRSDLDRERDARERARRAGEAEAAAAAEVSRADTERVALAARLGVPSSHQELDRFAQLVEDLGDRGKDAVQHRTRARDQADLAVQRRDDATRERSKADRRSAEAESADRAASTQRLRVDTLRRRLGDDDVTSVFDEVAALDGRIVALGDSIRLHGDGIEANLTELGEAAGAINAARDRIVDAEGRCRATEARLPVLRGREVLALLDLPGDDIPLEPVPFALWNLDRLGASPAGYDHDQAKRAVDRAQKQLLDDLHQGYAPAIVHDDDLILIEVTADDRSVFGLAELRARLESQVLVMEQHLTESDREIFERHLLNRVSHELRRLLGEADEFVNGVNEALARTRTASGLQVELRWVPAGDGPDTRRALDLLRRDTEQMGDDDRAALRRFFDLAIRRQRAEDPDAGYRSNLEHVVDYRQWHRFEPYLVGPDGRARLTRERFRGLSGGEQAVALHLPLFAAASAHYDRADAAAPRLVALDEAFAGIDEAMRGELLGLTVEFDLDVLLTGHELWGAYAEVPAIAVHDLLRRPPLEGVSVLTLRWDGHDLSGDPLDVDGAGRTQRAEAPLGGLFADSPGGS